MLAIQIIGGLIALLGGGELLVRGASKLAVRLGLSPLVVGVLIVGFGTSVPELVTCVDAALSGAPGIAIGNIVGSNIANILLILGVAASLRPFATQRAAVMRDGMLVIATAVLFAAAAFTGMIDRWMGVVFVLGLAGYIAYTFRTDRANEEANGSDDVPTVSGNVLVEIVLIAGGLFLVIAGAGYLVEGAVTTARILEVPEEVIGLSLVAVGTSLPELATSIVAAARRQSEMALGNVLGSNIYNVLGIGGITALVAPIPVSDGVRFFDIPVMVAVSVGLVLVVATGQRVNRWEGFLLLGLYGVYLVMLSGGASI